MHQKYQEQQSKPRSTLEGNCVAGKQEDVYLVIPFQGHLHPHALQGTPEFRAPDQILVRVPTNKSPPHTHTHVHKSAPSSSQPWREGDALQKAQMHLRLAPRHLVLRQGL